ncbi:hypothetical protein BGX21_006437 [Mortierella sp. AD011]|nr:hypothetical protein BGX21_006437 [Mortierella sp. AD011]
MLGKLLPFSNSHHQWDFWKTYFTPNRFSHDQIPDLTGKVAIVTGGNSGLGYATVVALAANGAHVFLACRSKERALDAIERAKTEIKEKYPKAREPKLEFMELDLNDMKKTQQSARDFFGKRIFPCIFWSATLVDSDSKKQGRRELWWSPRLIMRQSSIAKLTWRSPTATISQAQIPATSRRQDIPGANLPMSFSQKLSRDVWKTNLST